MQPFLHNFVYSIECLICLNDYMKKKSLLFLSFFFIACNVSLVAQCTLTAQCTGGNWNAASTWTPVSCGAITTPTDACVIIIPACATVNVNINSPEYVNMEIYVYGTLNFGNGQKINMCPGRVEVFAGGQLTGGTPGSKINICGETVWNGGTTTSGPLVFGGGTTLPIELLSFTAHLNNNKVDIAWSTASETNNDFFTIERSRDGLNFEEVMNVDGAGNSTTIIDYFEIDQPPLTGISYYRLKQTDFDGEMTYSHIVPVEYNPTGDPSISLFPNPANADSQAYLELNHFEGQEILVVLRDIQGKEIYSKVVITMSNNELVALNQDGLLSKGTYLITASSANKLYSKRLIVK